MATDTEAKLVRCFSAVFPDLDEQVIRSASLDSVQNWDSVATITLATVIEQEFGFQFEPNALEHLVSFGSILDYLKRLPAVQ
jgi:acyl carrier protein